MFSHTARVAALASLVVLGAAPCQAQVAGGELDVIYTRLSSRVEHERAGGFGNTLDVHDDLPADRYEPAYEVDAWVWVARLWRLEGRYLGATYRERGTSTRGFVHDAVVFSPGDPLEVAIDIHVVSLGARVVTFDEDGVRLSLPFGVLYTQERLLVRDRLTADRGDGRVEAWSPYVGIAVEGQLSPLVGLAAEARTFAYLGGHVDHYLYFELDAKVTLTLLDGQLRLHTGPRLFAQDHRSRYSNHNDQRSDFTLVGWQLGATFEF